MRRRSLILGALAAVAGAAFGALPLVSRARSPEVLSSPNFRDLREPRLDVVDRIRAPSGGDIEYVIFDDPDRLYRAPGDDTSVTRGGIVFAELDPGRWYACAIECRAGDQLFTTIMNVSWS